MIRMSSHSDISPPLARDFGGTLDRVRTIVNTNLSRRCGGLLEPPFDRLQRMCQSSIPVASELKLDRSVCLERDMFSAEEAHHVNDEEVGALNVLRRNPDFHHDSPSPLALGTPLAC